MLLTSLTRAWLTAPAVVLALLSLPLNGYAQAKPASHSGASAASDLSPAQQARIQARQAQLGKDVAALRADTKLTDAQKQTKYAALMQGMDKDVLAILTPTQRAQEMRRRQINAQFQKDVAALKADAKLTEAQKKTRLTVLVEKADAGTLSTLTPSQKALVMKRRQTQEEALQISQELRQSQTPAQAKKIHDISVALRAKMEAVVADKSLSNQAKTAKLKELTGQEETQINTLLTPAQRIKFQQWQRLVSASQAR